MLSSLICICLLLQPHVTLVGLQTWSATWSRCGRQVLGIRRDSCLTLQLEVSLLDRDTSRGESARYWLGTESEMVSWGGPQRWHLNFLLVIFFYWWTKFLPFLEGKRRTREETSRCILTVDSFSVCYSPCIVILEIPCGKLYVHLWMPQIQFVWLNATLLPLQEFLHYLQKAQASTQQRGCSSEPVLYHEIKYSPFFRCLLLSNPISWMSVINWADLYATSKSY